MNLELRIPPPVVVVIFAIAMWLVAIFLPGFGFWVAGSWIFALALAFAGFVVAMMGADQFKKAQTTRDPTKPENASSLVTTGIFRRSRNPMYLGLLLLLTGWAIYLSNILNVVLLAGFVAYMTRFQIKPEERVLFEKFGADYQTYRQQVRRWL